MVQRMILDGDWSGWRVFYTDASKLSSEGCVGVAVYDPSNNDFLRIQCPSEASVFTRECLGLLEAWSLKQLVQKLTPIVKRPFTALQFGPQRGMQQPKVAFLRFPSEVRMDLVLNKLQNIQVNSSQHTFCMFAFIPTNVPQTVLNAKGKGQDKKMARKFGIVSDPPEVTFTKSMYELLRELQMKYMKLYHLSASLGHRLLDDIADIIFERLATVVDKKNQKKTITMTNSSMTKTYRSEYPHRLDYEMVMSTLHSIEDELDRPRTRLTEKELFDLPTSEHLKVNPNSGPMLQAATTKIMGTIADKVLKHIRQLDTSEPPQSTVEQRATVQVRTELKKQEPYLAEIIRETVMKDVMPVRPSLFKRVKIFGEPYIPARETVLPALGPIASHCTQVRRCMRLYNCLLLNVQTEYYPQFLKLNGTKIGAATLVCRPSDLPIHGIPERVLDKVKVFYGLASKPAHPTDQPDHPEAAGQTGDHEEDMDYQAEDIDFDEIDADVEGVWA